MYRSQVQPHFGNMQIILQDTPLKMLYGISEKVHLLSSECSFIKNEAGPEIKT